ncbi:hypothetical protein BRADI_5g03470v3 [Brachypodium distachyon]|uniref:Uncharacterized protein n=1 Tax=Brachypodium distachyon TaxID=15368 RepID=I1IW98_BRADI|nr:hypothetical protein BRADI_5g03470v3 [Brachypodium distachyon]
MQASRSIPSVMETYNLDDVVTACDLRSAISKQVRKNQGVSDPKVPSPLPNRSASREWIDWMTRNLRSSQTLSLSDPPKGQLAAYAFFSFLVRNGQIVDASSIGLLYW